MCERLAVRDYLAVSAFTLISSSVRSRCSLLPDPTSELHPNLRQYRHHTAGVAQVVPFDSGSGKDRQLRRTTRENRFGEALRRVPA
jgi:hypothetical protein